MNKTSNLFELILKTGGILTFLLIIICFIDIKLFYSEFNINIEEYISTSDVIFVAIDKLVLLFVVFLIQLVIWFLWLDKVEPQPSKVNEDNEQPTLFKHDFIAGKFLRRGWAAYWIILFAGLVTSTICSQSFPESHSLVKTKDFFYYSFLTSTWLVLSIQFTSMALNEMKEKDRGYIKMIMTASVFLIIIFVTVVSQSSITAHRIKKGGNRITTELLTNENIAVKSTDTLIYIGHTGSYYFFWNKVTEETSIYNQDQIKLVKIK